MRTTLCKSSRWDDRSLCYCFGFHFLDDLFHFEGEQFAQEQCQVHCLVVILECSVVCQLDAMLIEFRVLLEVGF